MSNWVLERKSHLCELRRNQIYFSFSILKLLYYIFPYFLFSICHPTIILNILFDKKTPFPKFTLQIVLLNNLKMSLGNFYTRFTKQTDELISKRAFVHLPKENSTCSWHSRLLQRVFGIEIAHLPVQKLMAFVVYLFQKFKFPRAPRKQSPLQIL